MTADGHAPLGSAPAAGPVVLIGLMGTGKTTVGRLLAARWHRPFVDNDEALVARCGRTAGEIAATDGVDVLHRLEAESVLAVLAGGGAPVVAAAASTVLDPAVRAALERQATVVWLRASTATLAARLADPGTRPRLGDDPPARAVAAQQSRRDPYYRAVADLVVDTTGRSVDEVAAAVADALAPQSAGG